MSKDFKKDLPVGDYGEQLWFNHLKSKGHPDVFLSEKNSPVYWDVLLVTEDESVSFEVKYDEKAYVWAEKTGRPPNFFLECWSNTRNQPCGVMILECDYLVYIIKGQNKETAYLFDVEDLISHLKEANRVKKYRLVQNSLNGDNNVKGWAIPIESLTKKQYGFIKQINLSNNEKDND